MSVLLAYNAGRDEEKYRGKNAENLHEREFNRERRVVLAQDLMTAFLVALIGAVASTTAPPCGLIGLGIMGKGMANNLLKAGVPLHVWSRDRSVCEAFAAAAVEDGTLPLVTIADTPAACVAACKRTYLMLSTPAACEEVYTMDGGVLDGVTSGTQLVDCATLQAGDMISLAARVRAKGGAFVEAPVSGSKGPAATGTLIFMAAGDRNVFEAATDELAAMGKRSVFVSEEVGAATKMKLVVNLIMGGQCVPPPACAEWLWG